MKDKLTKHDEKQLANVLESAGIDLLQARGFLAHLHCHPRALDPSVWASALAGVEPEQEFWPFEGEVMEWLFVLYNQLHDEVKGKGRVMPVTLRQHLDKLGERDVPQPLRHWLAGYMGGFLFLKDAWQELLTEDQFAEVEACAGMLGYIATLGSDEEHALAWREGAEPAPAQLITAVDEALEYMRHWGDMEVDENGQLVPFQTH